MWLPTDQGFIGNAKSPYNDTRRMSTDQRKGIHRSYPPGHYIQPTYHLYCRRNWNVLQSKERLARIFNKPPLEAYRLPISLRDILMSTKFKTVGNTPLPRGCELTEHFLHNKRAHNLVNNVIIAIIEQIRKII